MGYQLLLCMAGQTMSEFIRVHGAVTYAQFDKDYPIKTKKKLFWIGYDCSHFMDELQNCNLRYCIDQCETMANQLKDIEIKDRNVLKLTEV
jgi:hypothetical protein